MRKSHLCQDGTWKSDVTHCTSPANASIVGARSKIEDDGVNILDFKRMLSKNLKARFRPARWNPIVDNAHGLGAGQRRKLGLRIEDGGSIWTGKFRLPHMVVITKSTVYRRECEVQFKNPRLPK